MFDRGKWALGNAVPWDIAAGAMVGRAEPSHLPLWFEQQDWKAVAPQSLMIRVPWEDMRGSGPPQAWQHFCWVTWGRWCDIYFDSVPSHCFHDSCRTASICSGTKPMGTELYNSAFLFLFKIKILRLEGQGTMKWDLCLCEATTSQK